jgi:hypothetical protein
MLRLCLFGEYLVSVRPVVGNSKGRSLELIQLYAFWADKHPNCGAVSFRGGANLPCE